MRHTPSSMQFAAAVGGLALCTTACESDSSMVGADVSGVAGGAGSTPDSGEDSAAGGSGEGMGGEAGHAGGARGGSGGISGSSGAGGVAGGAGGAPPGRDWRYQPFLSTSCWNHPIGSGAVYAEVPGLTDLAIGWNHDQWTSGVYVASDDDPEGTVYFYEPPSELWTMLHDGTVQNAGNDVETEAVLMSHAGNTPREYCYYCTAEAGATPVPPSSYHRNTDPYFSQIFRMPLGATPSPDSDGLMSVFQPNGWVLDTYATVVLSNGDIVCGIGSYVDARGEGDGWWQGRRASFLPSFGGLIRRGEIASGDIRHALAAQMAPAVLTEQAIWPAVTFDTNSGYGGTLPMGALLAIPPEVDVADLGLSEAGATIARAAQDYGIYVVDRGGSGMSLLAELGASEPEWTNPWRDLEAIRDQLRWLTNNGPDSRGGGGTPRRELLPEVQ